MKTFLRNFFRPSLAVCFLALFSGSALYAQSDQLDFDFTSNFTFGGCSGDNNYDATSGNETINGTSIPAAATINSIDASVHYGQFGSGSATINMFLNGNAIGSFTGVTSSCNSSTISGVDASFFNADGPNTISFTSSGSGTKVLYNATITVNYTPCTPPPAPGVADIDYCLDETADPLMATGSDLLWYTAPTGGTGSPDAPVPTTNAAGTETFYVSQTAGCESDRAAIDVTINTLPSTEVVGFTNISCFGASDGTITVSANGGAAPYTYSLDDGQTWSAPDDATHVFTGLAADEAYELRVQDNNGCESKPVQ